MTIKSILNLFPVKMRKAGPSPRSLSLPPPHTHKVEFEKEKSAPK